MINKNETRKQIKHLINLLSEENKQTQSRLIFVRLEKLEAFQRAKKIMLFWSLPDEVNTHTFVKKLSYKKTIYLPVMSGDSLVVKKFDSANNLRNDNKYIIQEPVGETVFEPSPDIIIVPGVAFDRNCNRMGRGKAFYDRFLSAIHKPYLIALAFNEQIVENVPVEAHDIPMNVVITPNNTFIRKNY